MLSHGPPTNPEYSRRKAKRTRSSPSKALREALLLSNEEYPLPVPKPQKIDISYLNVQTASRIRYREELFRQHAKVGRRMKEPALGLNTILARYINVVYQLPLPQHEIEANPLPLATVAEVLSNEANNLLVAKGYSLEDLRMWASIIMAKNVQVGAEQFLAHAVNGEKGGEDGYKPLPTFIFLMFLQRKDIGPTALRYLVIYAWHQLRRKQRAHHGEGGSLEPSSLGSVPSSLYPIMNDSSFFIALVRLIRHARKSWPAALISLSGIMTSNFGYSPGFSRSSISTSKNARKLQRLEHLFNTTLVLLSHPSPINPFNSVRYQETAQFDILQRMARHRPPLAVTLDGYRGIVAVQLRNKKTLKEQDWDQLKSKSWPPWKQDKTGLDEEKGPEYGVSRALEVIHRMHEAGYRGGLWEKVAQVLAGWDVDASPTIQTRAIHSHEAGVRNMGILEADAPSTNGLNYDPNASRIWEGRIRTTRTVQEAWACFLAYNDRKLPPHQGVYLAMFEKIHYEEQRRKTESSTEKSPIGRRSAGDAREVFPIPESPREATYVRIDPPTLDELATDMYSKGLLPQGRCLIFLLQKTESLTIGLKYLEWASRIDSTLLPLLSFKLEGSQTQGEISELVIAAFVKLLCRSSPSYFRRVLMRRGVSIDEEDPSDLRGDPLTYSTTLLKNRKLRYHPAWHITLLALGNPRIKLHVNQFEDDLDRQQINRYMMWRTTLAEMRGTGLQCDVETLRILCVGLGQTILICLEMLDRGTTIAKQCETSTSEISPSGDVVARQQEQSLVLNSSASTSTPTIDKKQKSAGEISADVLQDASKILQGSRRLICNLFYLVMGTKNTGVQDFIGPSNNPGAPMHPLLLAEPSPQVLHGLLRVLGLLSNWHGMVELVEWMVLFQKEVFAATVMPRNGPQALRKAIVSVRVFCERSWVLVELEKAQPDIASVKRASPSLAALPKAESAAPNKVINRMRQHIESVEAWGGWPSDQEVREYCHYGQFPKK